MQPASRNMYIKKTSLVNLILSNNAAPAAPFRPVVPVPISCVDALPTMTAPAASIWTTGGALCVTGRLRTDASSDSGCCDYWPSLLTTGHIFAA